MIFTLVCMWRIFTKAGKEGWKSLIPIYNLIVLLEIVELPAWYIILYLVPIANIYVTFKIYIELAHKFGKSTGFGVALVFFGVICLPILAFGNVKYNGNDAPTMQQSMNNIFGQDVSTPQPSVAPTMQQPINNNVVGNDNNFN